MKKIFKGFLILLFTFTLVGCSQSVQDELQANTWNVVSSNGEAYTADFGESTVTFDTNLFQRGFNYSIDEDEETITLDEPDTDEEPIVFIIDRSDNTITFEATTEEIRESYGNLILSSKS